MKLEQSMILFLANRYPVSLSAYPGYIGQVVAEFIRLQVNRDPLTDQASLISPNAALIKITEVFVNLALLSSFISNVVPLASFVLKLSVDWRTTTRAILVRCASFGLADARCTGRQAPGG